MLTLRGERIACCDDPFSRFDLSFARFRSFVFQLCAGAMMVFGFRTEGITHSGKGSFGMIPRWVTMVLLTGLAAGFGKDAFAAAQQVYDDCSQTSDIARSIDACTRIVNDQNESIADRAASYTALGNDNLALAKLDEAIADYDSAIQLDQKNIFAYASRAIAYARKGERWRAFGDYGMANSVDWFKLDEMIAANPELSEIAKYKISPIKFDERPPSQLPPPTPKELDECANTSQEPKHALAVCTRILDERNPTPAEAFAVELARPNLYLKLGDFAHALAAYDQMIALRAPGGMPSALVYAGRAVAYSSKGDREHAVIDYVIAKQLDPKAVDEMEAKDQKLAAIAESARLSPPPERDIRGFDTMYRPNTPRLGIQINSLTPSLVEKLNLSSMNGVYVNGVNDAGPAKLAGIMPGDIIVRFDGEEVRSTIDAVRFVSSSPLNKNIEVVLLRNGVSQKATVMFAPLQSSGGQR
jgi:tetratricopeptide (TPR) repeat protein